MVTPSGWRAIGSAKMQIRRAEKSKKPETLTALYNNAKTSAVRDAVVNNQHTPVDILIASYRSDHSRKGENRLKILNHPKVQAQLQLARESNSPDELAELSQSPFYEVRLEAARNPKNSPDALAKLAFEPPPLWNAYGRNDIQRAADANPNTPGDTLTARALGVIPRARVLELVPKMEGHISKFFLKHESTENLDFRPGVQSNPILAARKARLHRLEKELDMLVTLCRPSRAAAVSEKVAPAIAALYMTHQLVGEQFNEVYKAWETKEELFSVSLEGELLAPVDVGPSGMLLGYTYKLMLYDSLKDILSVIDKRHDGFEVRRQLERMNPQGPILLFAAREISELDKRISLYTGG